MIELHIHDEVAAFIEHKPKLLKEGGDPWVVFALGQFQKRLPTFEAAYNYASEHFEDGKFLIRDVHGEDPFIPLMFVSH